MAMSYSGQTPRGLGADLQIEVCAYYYELLMATLDYIQVPRIFVSESI